MDTHHLQIVLAAIAAGMVPPGFFFGLLLLISSENDPGRYEDATLRAIRRRERKKFIIALAAYGCLAIVMAGVVVGLGIWMHYT